MSGLRIVTIRDRQSSECYTVFIFESPAPEPAVATADPAEEAAQASARRVQEAAAERERQLAELQPTPPLKRATDFPSVIRPPDTTRLKIEEEFERTLRQELPGGPPWASLDPGVKTGGSEDLSNDLRRAMLDTDPASPMKAMEDQLARLDALLRQLIAEPRLAASGPVRCPATAAKDQP